MDALQAVGEEGGGDGAFGEAFTGEGLVGEGQLVHAGEEGRGVGAGDLPDALGADFGLNAERIGDDFPDAFGCGK